jgi:hypothetical protein
MVIKVAASYLMVLGSLTEIVIWLPRQPNRPVCDVTCKPIYIVNMDMVNLETSNHGSHNQGNPHVTHSFTHIQVRYIHMPAVRLAARRSAWTLWCSAQRNVPPYYVDTVWIYVTVDPVGSTVLYNKQRQLF